MDKMERMDAGQIKETEEIARWMQAHEEEFLQDLADFVAIPSVSVKQEGEGAEEAPYGQGCADCLNFFLKLGEKYGFETENLWGQFGRLRWKGTTGKKRIGIFAHGDVVPVDENWERNPFLLWRKGNWLVGRGVDDNKGPALSVFYALRYLKEKGFLLQNTVEMYLGSAEETGMWDIKELLKRNYSFPDFSLIPDAGFPVCYGEKGILRVLASVELKESGLLEFTGGEADNIVAAKAKAVLAEGMAADLAEKQKDCRIDALAEKQKDSGIKILREKGKVTVFSAGLGKHSAFPEGSRNAIGQLARFLTENGFVTGKTGEIFAFLGRVTEGFYGEELGIAYEDEPFGRLTHVLTRVWYENGTLKTEYNIRYPYQVNQEEMLGNIEKTLRQAGFTEISMENDAPFLREKGRKAEFLTALSNEILGAEDEPYVMSGGTYARRVPGAVAYGFGNCHIAESVPFPVGHGGAHQPDEAVHPDKLRKGMMIYVLALRKLDEEMNEEGE